MSEGGEFQFEHIIATFEQNGIAENRIICTEFVKKEEHVRRAIVADVMVDPFICHGHTTSLDALWPGTPIVTKDGGAIHNKATTSMLHVLQVPALITTTNTEFENRLIWFANHPEA